MGHRMTRFIGALALAAAIATAGAARAQNYSPTGICPTHQWNDAYGSATVVADCRQPAFGDISGIAASSQLPVATTGAVGGVQIGAGLQVSSGTVSATSPQAGYFSFSSSTLVQFCPENGALAQVAGAALTIPSACVTAANTSVQVFSTGSASSTANLANSTLYYAGVLNNSGSLAIAFFPASAYSHMPDTTAGNLGVEVLSSSGSPLTGYTLVGNGLHQREQPVSKPGHRHLVVVQPADRPGLADRRRECLDLDWHRGAVGQLNPHADEVGA